jgi:CubicO group peptidase (beta-lactamase class C family)
MIKKILLGFFALLLGGVLLMYVTGYDYIFTSIERTYLAGNVTANINDHKEFKANTIKAGTANPLKQHTNYGKKALPENFTETLEANKTAAFLVLQDGKVLSETYFGDYDNRSKTNSFSMAKTVITMLLGIAIEEGYVRDLDQPIVDFLPEFSDDPIGKTVTARQLSLMNSGYDWDEQYYSPFSPTVELYYGDDVDKYVLGRDFTEEAGTFWEYSSASTQLLGLFLLRAIQKPNAAQTLSGYLGEKIWQPMQMNDDALWHTDDIGMELVYCCINTNARNYAKLGLLLQNKGIWNGQQIIPADFVKEMIQPKGQSFYGLSTWLGMHKSPAHYWFSGHLGQFIINVPERNLTIVRLGETPIAGKDHLDNLIPWFIEGAMHVVSADPSRD